MLVKNFEFVTPKPKDTQTQQEKPPVEIVYEGKQIEEMAQIAENTDTEIPF